MATSSSLYDQIDNQIETLAWQRKKAKILVAIFSISSICVFLFFGYLMATRIQSNFEPDKVNETLAKKATQFKPWFRLHSTQLFKEMGDAYQKELIKQAGVLFPQLKDKLIYETKILNDALTIKINRSLSEQLSDDFLNEQTDYIFKVKQIQKPDDRQWQQDRARLNEMYERFMEDMQNYLIKRYQSDVDRLMQAAKTFPREQRAVDNEEKAMKYFIHYWLYLIDQKIMEDN